MSVSRFADCKCTDRLMCQYGDLFVENFIWTNPDDCKVWTCCLAARCVLMFVVVYAVNTNDGYPNTGTVPCSRAARVPVHNVDAWQIPRDCVQRACLCLIRYNDTVLMRADSGVYARRRVKHVQETGADELATGGICRPGCACMIALYYYCHKLFISGHRDHFHF